MVYNSVEVHTSSNDITLILVSICLDILWSGWLVRLITICLSVTLVTRQSARYWLCISQTKVAHYVFKPESHLTPLPLTRCSSMEIKANIWSTEPHFWAIWHCLLSPSYVPEEATPVQLKAGYSRTIHLWLVNRPQITSWCRTHCEKDIDVVD
jgi:hypothetical protein